MLAAAAAAAAATGNPLLSALRVAPAQRVLFAPSVPMRTTYNRRRRSYEKNRRGAPVQEWPIPADLKPTKQRLPESAKMMIAQENLREGAKPSMLVEHKVSLSV